MFRETIKKDIADEVTRAMGVCVMRVSISMMAGVVADEAARAAVPVLRSSGEWAAGSVVVDHRVPANVLLLSGTVSREGMWSDAFSTTEGSCVAVFGCELVSALMRYAGTMPWLRLIDVPCLFGPAVNPVLCGQEGTLSRGWLLRDFVPGMTGGAVAVVNRMSVPLPFLRVCMPVAWDPKVTASYVDALLRLDEPAMIVRRSEERSHEGKGRVPLGSRRPLFYALAGSVGIEYNEAERLLAEASVPGLVGTACMKVMRERGLTLSSGFVSAVLQLAFERGDRLIAEKLSLLCALFAA